MKRDKRIYVFVLILVLLLTRRLIATVQSRDQDSKITAMAYNPNGDCLYAIVNDRDEKGNSLFKLFIFARGKLVRSDPCYKENEPLPVGYQTGVYENDRIVLGPFSARGGRLTGPNGLNWKAPSLFVNP